MKTQHGSKLTGAEMGEMLDEFANGARKEDKEEFIRQLTLVTHRTIQQRVMGLVVGLLEGWASLPHHQTDPRNAATVALATKFISKTDKYDRALPYI